MSDRCRPPLSFALALLLSAAGCDAGPASRPADPATVPMTVGGKTYRVEVAADEPSRQHGLMERGSLPADHGMIFVFSDEQPRDFWMHHTRFNLDILYLDHAGRVVSVHTMRAYDEGTTPSDGPAQYAVELNAGQAAAAGVHAGDTVALPPAVTARPAR